VNAGWYFDPGYSFFSYGVTMKFILSIIMTAFLTACSSSDDSPAQVTTSGLKIFATSEIHVGDFANDPTLSGANAIEKADFFCNQDSGKPDDKIYKALLIDGINRDAKSLTDWVLLPNTTYYRAFDNIEIGATISTAIFPVLFQDLTNSVDVRRAPLPTGVEHPDNVWSGITDLTDYTNDGSRDCNGWTTSNNVFQGIYGYSYEKTSVAISTQTASVYCGAKLRLYCVEQM
jgi:hypothetical protein